MSVDYFDRLEDELRAAVPRVATWPEAGHGADERAGASANGSAGPTRRLVRHVPLAPIGLAAAVVVAIVVVVGAVALLGREPSATTGPTRPSGPPPATAGAYPTLQQLKDNFAILRRPQTNADRAWSVSGARTSLTRLAQRLPDGHRVILSVGRRGARGDELFVWIASGNDAATGAPFAPDTDYTLVPFGTGVAAPLGFRWTSVVPDSVSRVRWTFSCTARRSSCARIVRSVTARDNVATAAVAGTDSCPDPTCRNVVSATWYAANGAIIASWNRAEHRTLTAPPFRIRATAPLPAAGPILAGDRIDGIRFGRPLAALVRRLRPMLGAPKISSGPEMCGIDGTAAWPAARAGERLDVYTHRSRIVGYQYGGADGTSKPHGYSLTTTRGLAIGDTLARGRALYGPRFRISNAQGGTWLVGTGYYGLRGYAWANQADSVRPGPHSPVSSIAAGDVGCPALSP